MFLPRDRWRLDYRHIHKSLTRVNDINGASRSSNGIRNSGGPWNRDANIGSGLALYTLTWNGTQTKIAVQFCVSEVGGWFSAARISRRSNGTYSIAIRFRYQWLCPAVALCFKQQTQSAEAYQQVFFTLLLAQDAFVQRWISLPSKRVQG